jgi:hypothetical protein
LGFLHQVKWGIPDHWLVLGLSICELMVLQWQWMPQVVPWNEKG